MKWHSSHVVPDWRGGFRRSPRSCPRRGARSTRRRGSSLEAEFDLAWTALGGPALLSEHRFHPTRRWRFDRAHASSKTAIELEGGIWIQGRHTRGQGFQNDTEKYNTAQLLGWTVFRLTKVESETLVRIIQHIGRSRP